MNAIAKPPVRRPIFNKPRRVSSEEAAGADLAERAVSLSATMPLSGEIARQSAADAASYAGDDLADRAFSVSLSASLPEFDHPADSSIGEMTGQHEAGDDLADRVDCDGRRRVRDSRKRTAGEEEAGDDLAALIR